MSGVLVRRGVSDRVHRYQLNVEVEQLVEQSVKFFLIGDRAHEVRHPSVKASLLETVKYGEKHGT